MKQFFKKYQNQILVTLTTIFIVLILYAIKGIYPFGNMTIINGDMGQGYTPFYVFLYDIIYNGKSIFYDYTLGAGSNMFGGFIVDGLFNPTAYLVLLNTRENIPYMLSYVLMAKIAFIALSSYILFNNIYKDNKFYNFLFSIMYAFSGFVLMYNTNIMWLDIVGLFPLLILSLKSMFEKGKIHLYSIILALILIYNYNLAYMVCLFIILIVPVYIFIAIPKERRKKTILNLIIGTGIGVGLSAFATLPSFMQVMTSFRLTSSLPQTNQNIFFIYKISILLFYSLPIYGFIKYILTKENNPNLKKTYIIAFIMVAIIPIIFEEVNQLWHSGSYQLFPYRYGFIPILIISLAALRYFSKVKEEDNQEKNIVVKIILLILFAVATIIGINNSLVINANTPAMNMSFSSFIKIEIVCVILIMVLYISSQSQSSKMNKIITIIIVITEVLIYSFAYIGVEPEKITDREISAKSLFHAYDIKEKLNIEKDLYRLKDLTALTTENHSLVYDVPGIATFLHIISYEQVLGMKQLGYSHHKTKMHNYGGTLFTDAILGVKYLLSPKELPNNIYNYIDELTENIYLYEYKNTLPIGITYEKAVEQIPFDLNIFEIQNYLYQNIFNKTDELFQIEEHDPSSKNYRIYNVEVKENSQLYLYSPSFITEIYINDEPVFIPTTNEPYNRAYGNSYYNGILDLGNYENQQVTIKLMAENPINVVYLGLLDISKYNKIFEEYNNNLTINIDNNTIKIKGESEKDTNLFIPINYDQGWTSEQTEIKRIYTNFMGIEIKEGTVDIELKFSPPLYKIGVIISIIAIILLFIITFIKKKIEDFKPLLNIAYYLFIAVAVLFFIKIYIIGIIQNFIN